MYLSLIINIRSSQTQLRGFQLVGFHHSFHCTNKLVILAKGFLKTKLAYANKTKESIVSQKLGSRNFWQIANSVLNNGKSAKNPLFNNPNMLSSASDKAKLFAETFLRTLMLTRYLFTYFPFLNQSLIQDLHLGGVRIYPVVRASQTPKNIAGI